MKSGMRYKFLDFLVCSFIGVAIASILISVIGGAWAIIINIESIPDKIFMTGIACAICAAIALIVVGLIYVLVDKSAGRW